MEDYKRKKKIHKTLYSRTGFVLLFIITLMLVKGAWGVYLKKKESAFNLVTVEQKLTEGERRKQELSAAIGSLKTQEGLEKEIRNKFSVAKEGEKVIIVVEPSKIEGTEGTDSGSFFKKIGRWIQNVF